MIPSPFFCQCHKTFFHFSLCHHSITPSHQHVIVSLYHTSAISLFHIFITSSYQRLIASSYRLVFIVTSSHHYAIAFVMFHHMILSLGFKPYHTGIFKCLELLRGSAAELHRHSSMPAVERSHHGGGRALQLQISFCFQFQLQFAWWF